MGRNIRNRPSDPRGCKSGDAFGSTPAGCWRSPRGKLLSKQDRIRITLPAEDLQGLCRAINEAPSCIDKIRDGENGVTFAERLVRLQEGLDHDGIVVVRSDIHALHQVLHGEALRLASMANWTVEIKRLVRIRKAVIDTVGAHDDVPKIERER